MDVGGLLPLTPEAHVVLDRTLFVIGALSVTATLAAVASLSVDAYGSLVHPRSLSAVSRATSDGRWSLP